MKKINWMILILFCLSMLGCKKVSGCIERVEKIGGELPKYENRLSILGYRVYACSKSIGAGELTFVEELRRVSDNSVVPTCDVFDCSKQIRTYQNGEFISLAGPGTADGKGGICSLGKPDSPGKKILAEGFFEYVVTAILRSDAPEGRYRMILKGCGLGSGFVSSWQWPGCEEKSTDQQDKPIFMLFGTPIYGPVISI